MYGPTGDRSLSAQLASLVGDHAQSQALIDDLVAQGTDARTPFHLCGWRDDPARHALARTFAPTFAQAAPQLMGKSEDVLLYKAMKEVLGDYVHYTAQKIGDCFVAGSPVTMDDGTEKPIEQVVVGDRVRSHLGNSRRVIRTIRKPYKGKLVRVGVRGESVGIECTPDHQFSTPQYTPGKPDWTAASSLDTGQLVTYLRPDGKGITVIDQIIAFKDAEDFVGDVFCLEVEEDHSFLVRGVGVKNCTSFGSGHALDLLQCIEIRLGKPLAFLETCTEAIYGMGREIAGMLGGEDGCYGVAVAKGLVEHGAVPRKLVGVYSGDRAKQWGVRGVPAEIKTEMGKHRLGAAALIKTLDEMDAALANLYPCAGGFGQGFEMHRNQDGECRQTGKWGHEQCCAGRRTLNGRRKYLMWQSWGDNVPDGPTVLDQPSFSFWIDEDAMADILGQGDFLAFSGFDHGFEERSVPSSWSIEEFAIR